MVATWGTMSLARARRPPGRESSCRTRSGNTRTPDEAWSDWSAPYTNAEGSPITSPKARYLQWRAVLTGKGDSPVLTSVTRRVSAAQRAARCDARSPSTRRASSSRSRSRPAKPRLPASTPTPIERRWPTSAGATPAAPRSAAARIRRACRRLCGRPRTRTATSCLDVLYRREGETPGRRSRAA